MKRNAPRGGALVLATFWVLAGWTGPMIGPIVVPGTDADPAGSALSQDPQEAVMVAAGEWALGQLPGSTGRLDPHRSGAGKDGARIDRVARTLGVGLAPLDEVRSCADVMDPGSCALSVDRLLAIAAPVVDGDDARVKVYAWYRSGSSAGPVAQRDWELRLTRSASGWRVVSGG
jgi:hypothetical protein